MTLIDLQIDRLVGPTHHFGGLGVGNIASQDHAGQVSNPKAAAVQGLDKMKLVASLGAPQMILPPQPRPDTDFLRRLGFDGSDIDILSQACEHGFALMSASISSSAMWVANAATVSAGVDNRYGYAALTVANLHASLHRSIEPGRTFDELRKCLPPTSVVFEYLPGGSAMRDEGAANYMRLGTDHNDPGIHLFVYGDGQPAPIHRWPRQTRSACEAIARQHSIDPEDTFYLKQHPHAIDAGAFHNDVVAASHHDLLIHHELAFHDCESALHQMSQRYQQRRRRPLRHVIVTSEMLSLDEAVSTYLFNSQIVSHRDSSKRPVIICPSQVQQNVRARELIDRWCGREHVFSQVHFVDLSQSMAGGGGPACLRLRVPMTPREIDQIPRSVLWSDSLDSRLRQVIQESYPSEFRPRNLLDASVLKSVIACSGPSKMF